MTAAELARLAGLLLLLVCLSKAEEGRPCWAPQGMEGYVGAAFKVTRDACGSCFEFIVSILHNEVHHCSGVLIDQRFILTTAECVKEERRFPVVRAGTYNRMSGVGGQDFTVCQKIIHQGFNGTKSSPANLALLKLERKAELKVLPDFLTSLEQCTSKNISWMGYFKNFATAGPSEQLQAADKIYPISKKACEEKFGELPDDVECAKTEDNVNPISDEAAPLFCDGDKLIGLMSQAVQKQSPLYAFTIPGHFRDWIEKRGNEASVIEKNESCQKEL